MRAARLAFCLAPLLVGCARTADRDEAAICASAAAGLSTPMRVRVAASAPLPPDADGRPGLRLTLGPAAPGAVPPWLACRFDVRAPQPVLVAVDGPTGPIDETHLILLKRFWLGSADALAARGGDEAADLPEIPWSIAYPLQQALNALPTAAVYGLLAAAYSLVYGLYGRINLAFGELAATGGLAAAVGAGVLRDAPPLMVLAGAGLLGLCAAALFGATVDRLVLWRLRPASGQQGLIATVGIALALREYLRVCSGSKPIWVAPVLAEPSRLARAGDFIVTVTPMALVLAGAAAVGGTALLAAMRFTGFGRDWRASADDPLGAALMGVDPRRLALRTAALAGALAGIAGAGLTLNYGGIGFDYTAGLGLKSLIAAILGGIGSVRGAFLGGIGIALAEAAWSAWLPVAHRDLAIDLLLVAALVARPGGLFGTREPAARHSP